MPRSKSHQDSNITLHDIKEIIENSKADILDTMKKENERIFNQLSLLIKRVDEVEKRTALLEQRCNLETKTLDSTSILDEMKDRLRRKKGLVISGLPEPVEGSVNERKEADKIKIRSLLNDLCDQTDDSISRMHRIGRQQPDKPRLLRIVFRDEDDAKDVLYKAKELRNMPVYANIFINPDLTPSQREANKKLREEVKRRRTSGEDVIIRGNKVIPRRQVQNFQ